MPRLVESALSEDRLQQYKLDTFNTPSGRNKGGDEQVIELGKKIDNVNKKVSHGWTSILSAVGIFITLALTCATLGIAVENHAEITDLEAKDVVVSTGLQTRSSSMFTDNTCAGAKPDDDNFTNFDCTDAVTNAIEQSGANVTKGYKGLINNSATPPITTTYRAAGLCPVNVHWHLGAEHLSVGEYDEHGTGPEDSYAIVDNSRRLRERELASGGARLGYQCLKYDAADTKFTEPYDWQHCVDMKVGQTYEIHWPHSTVGACNTPYQYQTPFYDGVFCGLGGGKPVLSGAATTHNNVGVQAQVFTVVNDETYYYPDLLKGAIYTGNGDDWWTDVAIYTGSTTGTSRDNDVCSAYSPITWQVDRKCHLISASSFDKLCADMKAQVDDMTDDLYAHGSRKLVSKSLASAQETRL